MIRIPVALGARSYEVLVEPGLIDSADRFLAPFARGGRLIVVSDETVWAALGNRLVHGAGDLHLVPLLVPAGEASKSWAGLADLVERLIAEGVERGDTILAFGGGMVGDLAGLAAALVKRGCAYVQMPTSLLAQVDSSVGGKTAINAEGGKNLVGLFHQPAAVLVDPQALDTLPARQLRAGYAEIVKYGLIGDADFFAWCEAQGAALIAGDEAARRHAIATAIATKAAIVAEDERETTGRRALLNLGHTFGHTLEAETGFSDALLHGEAVAIGMVLAFRLAAERGLADPAAAARVARHLSGIGLPTTLAEVGLAASGQRLAGHIARDKKAESGAPVLILPHGIGAAAVDRSVPLDAIAAFLDRAD